MTSSKTPAPEMTSVGEMTGSHSKTDLKDFAHYTKCTRRCKDESASSEELPHRKDAAFHSMEETRNELTLVPTKEYP